MAIFGAGSNWGKVEKKDDFFIDHKFEIGWDYDSAPDLYYLASSIKVGDIIYLKANQVGSRKIRVKGIGIITEGFLHRFMEPRCIERCSTNPYLKIKWVIRDEFYIIIPESEGRLTNVRAATFYEEFLPYVQKAIIEKFLSQTIG